MKFIKKQLCKNSNESVPAGKTGNNPDADIVSGVSEDYKANEPAVKCGIQQEAESANSGSKGALEKIKAAIERSKHKLIKTDEEIAFEKKHEIAGLDEIYDRPLVSIRTWQEKVAFYIYFDFYGFVPDDLEYHLLYYFSPDIIAVYLCERTIAYVTTEDLESDNEEIMSRLIDDTRYLNFEARLIEDLDEHERSEHLKLIMQVDQWIQEQN